MSNDFVNQHSTSTSTVVSRQVLIYDNSKNLDDCIDQVLKELKDSDFVSILFLLMNFLNSPTEYLDMIKKDRSSKEKAFKELLSKNRDKKDLLIEVLGTLKKYRLLQLLGTCRHELQNKEDTFHKLSRLWKTLYRVCELIDNEKDSQCLKKLFHGKVLFDFTCPEIVLVEAYKDSIITDQDLTNLSAVFKNDRPDISTILDEYNIRSNLQYYHLKKPTSSSFCGIAVIINHETFKSEGNDLKLKDRKDSLLDVAALEKLWKMFGFQTIVHNNLSDEEVIAEFERLASLDHSEYDVFVSCYMSHGNEGIVYASNCRPIVISSLIDMMANRCETLLDKPKLFFIQACQGTQIQQGVSYPTIKLPQIISNNQAKNRHKPLYSDVLQVISSIPGYISFAPVDKMSWFIGSLVYNMEEYGDRLDVSDIMIKVNKEVSQKSGTVNLPGENAENCKQTVFTETTLRYKLKLRKLQL